MRQLILFVILMFMSVFCVITGNSEDKSRVPAQIYVVDSSVLRLIPLETELVENSTQIMASELAGQIIRGFDNNKKIRRVIPDKRQCLSVKMEGKTAVVNIRTKYFDALPENRELEQLIIYQLVNSLTSIEGIERVQFTIDGDTKKKFAGFVDMREIFVPDYLL